jgi:hypothetical protein
MLSAFCGQSEDRTQYLSASKSIALPTQLSCPPKKSMRRPNYLGLVTQIYTAESGSILLFQVFLGEHKFDRLGQIDLTGNVLQMASNKLAA